MTERTRRMPSPGTTVMAAFALFAAILVLLAWQVRSGRDPALGAGRRSAALAAAPRRVLVKKIVHRVIVTKVVQTDAGPVLVASAVPSTTVVSSSPAVVSSSAPAAAPVVTKTS